MLHHVAAVATRAALSRYNQIPLQAAVIHNGVDALVSAFVGRAFANEIAKKRRQIGQQNGLLLGALLGGRALGVITSSLVMSALSKRVSFWNALAINLASFGVSLTVSAFSPEPAHKTGMFFHL